MSKLTTAAEAVAALLKDETVAEVMIDGPERVYVERKGKLEDTGICFASEREVVDWANGLLALHGWEPVGEGRFWVEGRLADGSRTVVVIPPVAVNGPHVVIRKFSNYPITFEQLLEWGCINQSILDFFHVIMQSRLNVLVSGGTNSGKTTLLNCLTGLMPPEERLIAVESQHELRIRHERVVYLEAEAAQASGADQVGLDDLLRVAAHMRPDRLIVGELRGTEVVEVIRLMNLGYEGAVTLIHANSPRDALARLETMATIAEPSLTLPAIRAEIASALNLIIQQTRLEDGSRRVTSIAEVQDLKGDNIVLEEIFVWEKTGVDQGGRFVGKHRATGAVPSFVPRLAARGLTFPKEMFEA